MKGGTARFESVDEGHVFVALPTVTTSKSKTFKDFSMIYTRDPSLVLPLQIDLTEEEREKLFEVWTVVSSPFLLPSLLSFVVSLFFGNSSPCLLLFGMNV